MLKKFLSVAAAALLCASAAGCTGINNNETLPETEAHTENKGDNGVVIMDQYFVPFAETLQNAKYTAIGTFVSYENDGHTADYTFEITEVIRGNMQTGTVHVKQDNGYGSLTIDSQPVSYDLGKDIYTVGSEYALILKDVYNESAYNVPNGIIIPVNGSAQMYGLPLEEASNLSKNGLRELLS